jgi:hypothetical protein
MKHLPRYTKEAALLIAGFSWRVFKGLHQLGLLPEAKKADGSFRPDLADICVIRTAHSLMDLKVDAQAAVNVAMNMRPAFRQLFRHICFDEEPPAHFGATTIAMNGPDHWRQRFAGTGIGRRGRGNARRRAPTNRPTKAAIVIDQFDIVDHVLAELDDLNPNQIGDMTDALEAVCEGWLRVFRPVAEASTANGDVKKPKAKMFMWMYLEEHQRRWLNYENEPNRTEEARRLRAWGLTRWPNREPLEIEYIRTQMIKQRDIYEPERPPRKVLEVPHSC